MGNQITEIQKKRLEKLGLPKGAGMISQIPVAETTPLNERQKRLNEIKKGLKKETFKQILENASQNENQTAYQIPEPKQKNKQQPSGKAQSSPQLKEYGAKSIAEANFIENILTGESNKSGNATIGKMNDYGPQIDIASAIHQKALSLKEQKTTQSVKKQQGVFDIDELVSLIKNISKETIINETGKIVKKAIEEVLSQKSKNTYKMYNKEQKIVEINKKLYKLVPVKVKDR